MGKRAERAAVAEANGSQLRQGDCAWIADVQSNGKLDEKIEVKALVILSRAVYTDFGPTLVAEYLAGKHNIQVGRETVRGWMIEGKLWHASRQRNREDPPMATAALTRGRSVRKPLLRNFTKQICPEKPKPPERAR